MDHIEERKDNSGKIFLLCLLGFFLTFASVDAFFVYKAVNTHAGVVTKNAYEKGLAFDDTLYKARQQNQMNINADIKYSENQLTFTLPGIESADVIVKLVRPTHKGYDHIKTLNHSESGLYKVDLDLPLDGLWRAQIEAKWQDKTTKKIKTFNKTQNFFYQR